MMRPRNTDTDARYLPRVSHVKSIFQGSSVIVKPASMASKSGTMVARPHIMPSTRPATACPASWYAVRRNAAWVLRPLAHAFEPSTSRIALTTGFLTVDCTRRTIAAVTFAFRH